MTSRKSGNTAEPTLLAARFTDQKLRRLLALSQKLGLTRHRTLQLCYTVGIDVLSGQMDIYTPAAGKADNQQQQG